MFGWDVQTVAAVNTAMNFMSIVFWLYLFYRLLTKGEIVTRRENTLTLGLKDEIIEVKDQTIATQQETIKEKDRQIAALSEVGELLRDVLTIVKSKAE